MPYSTDDFDSWAEAHTPHPTSAGAATGHSKDHPLLTSVDCTGMPTFAKLRLQEHIKKAKTPFTSNLSVNEFLLTRQAGYEPVAQVLGASVYHVGWQWMPGSMFYGAGELSVLSHARTEAWSYAIGRLSQQASVAGTHAVVGVKMNRRGFDVNVEQQVEEAGALEKGDTPLIEVSLTGTAVRFQGQIASQRPMISTITGQEFVALTRAGSYPAGVVFGCCAWYQPSFWSSVQGGGSPVAWGTQFQNQEITDYTQGFVHARKTAVQRMFDQSQLLGAVGILDVELHTTIKEFERDVHDYTYDTDRKQVGVIMTVEAVGTAIFDTEPVGDSTVYPVVDLMG
jgi:uncharacterized protein YbjQ (UPF0145 family)